jgi:hypothetical protein
MLFTANKPKIQGGTGVDSRDWGGLSWWQNLRSPCVSVFLVFFPFVFASTHFYPFSSNSQARHHQPMWFYYSAGLALNWLNVLKKDEKGVELFLVVLSLISFLIGSPKSSKLPWPHKGCTEQVSDFHA